MFHRLALLAAFVSLAPPLGAQEAELTLPTPLSHYQDYDFEADARALAMEMMVAVPEGVRAKALALIDQGERGETPIRPEDIKALLAQVDLTPYRSRILRLLLHGSRVLDAVPDEAAKWLPLIHDSMLLFLQQLSNERLVDRLALQASLPRDASRGQRILAFIVETPSLQKLAQILARNPAIAPDIRASLTSVENGVKSAIYEEVKAVLDEEVSQEVRDRYHLAFDDHILAEASVGAVVEARYVVPGSSAESRAACKILKHGAVTALKEDLSIIDSLLAYLEEHADFYDIGDTPLVDIFVEIREALSREVKVGDERANLVKAHEYYADNEKIEIPAVLDFSTKNVTCMEFIDGEKVTDAFPGDAERRRKLARRVSDALTYDVLFSPKDEALFHGDPHAGNLFHVDNAPGDPYRIALLDWGLAAEFSRHDRERMVQLMLGLYLKDRKRLTNNVGVLFRDEANDDSQVSETQEVVSRVLAEGEGGMFELLDELIAELARQGHTIRFETAIFIKAQVTISGILKELDPDFEQDDYVMSRISSQVFKELHTRLARTIWFPAWNSHSYRSMMSNEDVKDVQFKRIGGAFKAVGKGIWTAVSFQWLF